MPDIITLPQLCINAGWQSHAFGKLYHLGGGKDAVQKALWADTGRSWHTAQDFAATQTGRRIIEGRNVTDGALNWCAWGAADGKDDDQPDGQIAAATVAMIEQLGDKPWFIGSGFMKPHDPFIAPKKHFDLYPPESLKTWRDPQDISPAPPQAVGLAGKLMGERRCQNCVASARTAVPVPEPAAPMRLETALPARGMAESDRFRGSGSATVVPPRRRDNGVGADTVPRPLFACREVP